MSEPNWIPAYIIVLAGIPLVSVSIMLFSVRQNRKVKTRASAAQKAQDRLFELIWFPWRKAEKEADVEVGEKPSAQQQHEDQSGSHDESQRGRREDDAGSAVRQWPVAETRGSGGPLSSHPFWARNGTASGEPHHTPWARSGEESRAPVNEDGVSSMGSVSRGAGNEDGLSVVESDYTFAPGGSDTGAAWYWRD